ncbi:hypothetical protein [Bradyrhizobium sp. ORS 375]|uniref:hypothetical protein n=1 Tax=Bradyrhizobium sp. (strain ORS 375) TaxID=566679 RepID=UPI00030CC914|nr:hypothetical protein [Bradyrhizobium sp. ORS 375]
MVSDANLSRQLAGHVENGWSSITHPAMGKIAAISSRINNRRPERSGRILTTTR